MGRARGASTRDVEYRSVPTAVELRSSMTGRTIGGYGVKFGTKSSPIGGAYLEVVEPSAFSKSRSDGWPGVVCRYQHKDEMLLGTVSAGTLRLSQDDIGIDYSVDVPESRSDVLELVQRNDITSSSFAFQAYDAEFDFDGGDLPVRHLTSCRLIDVAPVTIPAYPDATVGLRSLAMQFGEDPDDVFELARDNRLKELFVRTDNIGGRAYTSVRQATISSREALLQVMAMGPNAQRPIGLTPAQARRELTLMAQPDYEVYRQTAERQAELDRMYRAAAPYETAEAIGF
jgi:uncharacterized protein